MLQTPLSSMPGEAGNPIDLTESEEVAVPAAAESCYMATGDEFEGDEEFYAEEHYRDKKIVYLYLEACGPDGKPYAGYQAGTYYWQFNEPLWLLMDTLRQDFPIWGDYWKIVRSNGKELKALDKPKKLGFEANEYVSAKIFLLHLPKQCQHRLYLSHAESAGETIPG